MSAPDLDHPITIEPVGERLRVLFEGNVICDTTDALVMHETVYPAIYYVPRADTAMECLKASDHATKCPYKGTASYFTIERGGAEAENAVWCYEDPLDGVAEIKGRLAFYPRHVEFELGEGG